MASFPSIEPFSRSYDFGSFAGREEPAWAAGVVRYRHGANSALGQQLSLTYIHLNDSDVQLIRNHYMLQQGGVIPFSLPAIIWSGHTSDVFPAGIRWRYDGSPQEVQRSGGLVDVTVQLRSVL